MAASPSKAQINSALRRLQKKNPGVEFVVLRASNGEVAILPKGKDVYGNNLPKHSPALAAKPEPFDAEKGDLFD